MSYWLALISRAVGRGFLLTSGSFATLADAQVAALALYGRQLNAAPGIGNLGIYDDSGLGRSSIVLSVPAGWALADRVDGTSYNAAGGPYTASQYQAAFLAEARPSETTVGGPYLPDTDLAVSASLGAGGAVTAQVVEDTDSATGGTPTGHDSHWNWRVWNWPKALATAPAWGPETTQSYTFTPTLPNVPYAIEAEDVLDETGGAAGACPQAFPPPALTGAWVYESNPAPGEGYNPGYFAVVTPEPGAGATWYPEGGTLLAIAVWFDAAGPGGADANPDVYLSGTQAIASVSGLTPSSTTATWAATGDSEPEAAPITLYVGGNLAAGTWTGQWPPTTWPVSAYAVALYATGEPVETVNPRGGGPLLSCGAAASVPAVLLLGTIPAVAPPAPVIGVPVITKDAHGCMGADKTGLTSVLYSAADADNRIIVSPPSIGLRGVTLGFIGLASRTANSGAFGAFLSSHFGSPCVDIGVGVGIGIGRSGIGASAGPFLTLGAGGSFPLRIPLG